MSSDSHHRKSRRKRSYNTRLIRREYTYLILEIAELFRVHRNAPRQWIKVGLRTVDQRRPLLIHGSDLIDFLKRRQAKRKSRCAPDEFYCCRCRRPRRVLSNRVQVKICTPTKLNLSGLCGTCGTRVNRAGSVAKIAEFRKIFDAQMPSERRLSEPADPVVMCDLEEGIADA